MKILTVIPTQEELDQLVRAWLEQDHRSEPVATERLSILSFPALSVTVAAGGFGKAQFAVQTQYLIDQEQWELVICAGALVEELAIGDVVVATQTVEHDIRNRFGPPHLPRFRTPDPVLELCHQALNTPFSFRVHYGPIASGDEDVVSAERGAEIQARTGASAVAWEGAGGARASRFSGTPFVEIRGLTDNANSTAAADYKTNLEAAMENVAQVVTCLGAYKGSTNSLPGAASSR